jgi:NADH-quinone oxidoreductase subunit M
MNLLLLLVVGLPLVGAAALLLLPRRAVEPVAAGSAIVLSSVTLLGALLMLAATPWRTPTSALDLDVPWITGLGVRFHLRLDGISLPLVLLTAALGVLVAVHAWRRPPAGGSARSLAACLLAVEGGALATFTAADAVLFFVAFEVVLVPMWALIRWWGDQHDDPGRRDAAARFVLYTALGSALMLLGLLVVVLGAGTSDLVVLAAAHGGGLDAQLQLAAAVLLVLGLAVKVPVWPLHTWLAPAHTAAPTVGSVLLAGVLLKMGSYGLVRVVVPIVPDGFTRIAPVLGVAGVVGILWGGLVCLVERDLKRLVAFSSVAHMGFVALGIASGTPQGLQGALFANVAHGVITALLFVVAGGLKDRAGSGLLDRIGGGLRDRSPHLGLLLAVGCVAGLGLPGLAGFWGELLAITGAWQGSGPWRGWRTLAVLAAVGTALAAAYLLRVLRRIWQGDGTDSGVGQAPDATGGELAVAAPLAVAALVLGLVPGLLLSVTEPAVTALLASLRGAA